MDIKIPSNIKSLRLDIGLSTTAPNTYKWIRDSDDCFVIAVEPVLRSIKSSCILMRPVPNINNVYFIHAAIDNVTEPQPWTIYVTEKDIGCSSLYRPVEFVTAWEEDTTKISLKAVLDRIQWEKVDFDYIEYLKTDTQGNEIEVLKSMGKYLNKVVFIEIECDTNDQYHGTPSRDQTISFLEDNNFEFFQNCADSYRVSDGCYVDQIFINKNYVHLKKKIQIEFDPDERKAHVSLYHPIESEMIHDPEEGWVEKPLLLDKGLFALNYYAHNDSFIGDVLRNTNCADYENYYSFSGKS